MPTLPSHTAPNYVSSTSAKHAQIAYDPLTCTATNTVTLKQTTYNKSHHPIGFILANESMPGALKPAAGRYDNYENELRAANVLEDMQGKEYVICPAHADVVSVTALQTDHAFSSSEILKRQIKLIDELNKNQPFTESFIEDFNLEEFFVKVNGKFQGTIFYYERFYNDVDNLWNICQSCNLHKSDKDPLEWFKINDNFGPAFIEHLNKIEINSTGVILTAGGKGIAEIAIEWYRENHRSYIDTVKKLYTNVIFKIKNNLQKAAKATSEGDTLKAEGYNAQASLSTLLTSIAANVKHRSFQIPGVSPPSSPDSTQSVSSDAGAPIQAPAALIQDVVESIESRTDPFKKDMEKFIQKGVQNIVTKLSNQSQELASSGEARQVRYDENMKLANQYKTLYELHLKLASEDAPAISSTSQGSVDSSSSGNSMDEKNMESSITNISADSDRKRKHAQDDNTPQKMTSRGTFFDEPNESLSDQATSTAPHKKLRGESEDNPTSQTSSTLETDKTLRMKPKI